MYANGEGRKVDLKKAYAWSALASESGQEGMVNNSEELLQRNNDKTEALKSADKLKKKYGQETLKNKGKKKAADEFFISGSKCTGTKLGCRKH